MNPDMTLHVSEQSTPDAEPGARMSALSRRLTAVDYGLTDRADARQKSYACGGWKRVRMINAGEASTTAIAARSLTSAGTRATDGAAGKDAGAAQELPASVQCDGVRVSDSVCDEAGPGSCMPSWSDDAAMVSSTVLPGMHDMATRLSANSAAIPVSASSAVRKRKRRFMS